MIYHLKEGKKNKLCAWCVKEYKTNEQKQQRVSTVSSKYQLQIDVLYHSKRNTVWENLLRENRTAAIPNKTESRGSVRIGALATQCHLHAFQGVRDLHVFPGRIVGKQIVFDSATKLVEVVAWRGHFTHWICRLLNTAACCCVVGAGDLFCCMFRSITTLDV